MRFIVICILGLLLAGCPSSTQNTKKYAYISANNQNYTIEFGGQSIKVFIDSKEVHKALFLVFLDPSCQACGFYYAHLNHLTSSHKDLQVIGILQQPNEQIQRFIQDNHLIFEVIAPKSNSDMLQAILDSRLSSLNLPQLESAEDSTQPAQTESNTLESTTESIANTQAQVEELPFFVLCKPDGEIYQDYRGIIPEEIFSSDIAQMLD